MPEQEQDQEPQNTTTYQSSNEPVVSESFMRHRLDPDETLRKIQRFLNGKELRVKMEKQYDNNGKIIGEYPIQRYERIYKQKANDEGINSIMHFMTSYINKDMAQANFKRDVDYLDMVGKARYDLLEALVPNMEKWDIDDDEFGLIMDTCMAYIKGFLSRAIDNKERESYQQSVKETHSFSPEKNNKKFGLF